MDRHVAVQVEALDPVVAVEVEGDMVVVDHHTVVQVEVPVEALEAVVVAAADISLVNKNFSVV